MTYRVIQWSTGNVGRAALRCIIKHPELELVGVWVQLGREGGQGRGGVVRVAADRRARHERRRRVARARRRLRVLHRDRRPPPAGRDHRHGAHRGVGQEHRVELGGRRGVAAAPRPRCARRSTMRARRRACRASRPASIPGWANDILPLLLTGTCENVEQLRVMEIVNYKHYEQPTVLFETMGFGQALDAKPLLLIPGVLSFAWGGVVKVLAAGLGVEIEELREVHERRPAPEKIDLGFGVIEEGTTAALRFEVQGIVERRTAHHPRARDAPRRRVVPRLAATGRRRRLPRRRHRHAELPVRRADDARVRARATPASSGPRAASSMRSPLSASRRPGCCRRSTCRW